MNLNINPWWWGPCLWNTINSFISVYPENPSENDIISCQTFFKSIKDLIPCNSCKNSYNIYIKEDDTNVDDINNFNNKDNLIFFVYKIRNKVNNKINVNYDISFEYFKKKLKKMTCDNEINGFINNLREAPVIHSSIQSNIFQYLEKNTNFDIKKTKKIIEICKKFLNNPDFSLDNKYFLLFFDRNKKCRKIIKKIYKNCSINGYSLLDSIDKDRDLHNSLFFLGCSIIPMDKIKNYI